MNEENNKPIPEMKDIEFNNNIPVQNASNQVVRDINPGNVVNPGQQVVNNKVKAKKKKKKPKKESSGQGLIIALLIIMTLGLIGGMGYIYYEDNYLNKNKSIKTDVEEVHSPYRMSGNGLEDFDIHFLQLENKKVNKVYSPISIKYALAMLNEGTGGMSNAQIKGLIGDYNARKYTNSKNMSFANALFIRDSFKKGVKNSYITTLKNKYGAEIVYDPITSPEPLNKWVGDKTFNLIPKMFDDSITTSDFVLINALAIDMEWNKKIQATCSNYQDAYGVHYPHINFSSYVSILCDEYFPQLMFNNEKEVNSLEIGAAINRYDIISTLGKDNIKKTISEEYKKWLEDSYNYEYAKQQDELDVDAYTEKFIKELGSSYKSVKSSTDFSLYVDDKIKVFGKELKEYNGMTLEYIALMPVDQALDVYIKNMSAKSLNSDINKLKSIKLENFEDGKVTKIVGSMPLFKYDYELQLKEDLMKLGIKDVFDSTKADLSKLSTTNSIFINDASHKATIEFSNEGIKAAAATAVGGMGAVGGGFEHLYEVPVVTIDVTFDKPYLYLIRDKASGEIWFTGTVYNPSTK